MTGPCGCSLRQRGGKDRHAWTPRAQTARVEASFDAAVAAGRHRWPALTFPEATMQRVALMRMLLWFDQRGRCAGCGDRADRLLLDHCHVTGLVRGALCHRCNTLEAHGPAAQRRDYRRRPPAFWLGWVYPGNTGNPPPDVSAVTTAALEAWRTGAGECYIEAAWGSGWLQAHLPAAAEERTEALQVKRRGYDPLSDDKPWWRRMLTSGRAVRGSSPGRAPAGCGALRERPDLA